MANNIPFQQMGNTVRMIVNGAANTQSNVFTIQSNSPCQQYYLANADTNSAVYVQINATSNFNIALPDAGPCPVIALPPYAYKVFTNIQVGPGANVYAKIIGDAANATCYITPGEGF